MLFLWFYHACRRGSPRFLMVSDHINYLTFEDPGAVHTVRRALKLAHAGDLYGAAETAGVDVAHASIVSEGLRRGMRFSIGAEVDNDPRARPDAQNIVDAMRPDGIIRTVHFVAIDHPEKGADWQWPFDNPEFAHLFDVVGTERTWELYIAKLLDDIEKLPGHVVGHFYVPGNFGHWPAPAKLEEYEDRMLAAAAARGMAVEINTRFLYRDNPDELKAKYLAANERLIRKAKAKGVGIAIGSDAHSPKDQGNAFDVVLQMLDRCGVNEIVFPVGGRLARVVLRATREHLEAHAKKRETTTPGSSISGFSRAELGLPEQAEQPAASRARAVRDVGPKKRAADASRTTKRPEPSTPAGKSSSRRSADSSTSSSKAKAARKSAEPPKKAAAVKPAPKPAPKAAPKAAPKPAKAPVKAAKAPVKAAKPAAKTKAAKAAPKPKSAPKAAPKKKAAPAKPVKKAAAAKKPAVKAPARPAAKSTAKKSAAKPAAAKKKLAAKPAAKAPAKKAAKKKKPAAKRR